MDTMTLTKVGGALCTAFLVLLLGNWAARELYAVGSHGHGEHHQAYVIETGAEEEVEVAEAEPVDFDVVYASADASAGEGLWRACRSCHALEQGVNGTGPYLYGVVGRDKGSVDGFGYSDAMASQEGAWTPENLQAFLESPRSYTPGTIMAYNGMRDIEDRADLIAYLATFGG